MKPLVKIPLTALMAVFSQWAFTQPAAAESNLYRVFLSADGVTTNDFGRLRGVFASNFDIIRKCASDSGISDLRRLMLVYDRDADALEVVNRADGTVICTPFTFSGGVSLPNTSGTFVERLAFVYLDGNEDAAGTIRATERSLYDRDGNLVRFSLRGKLQFAMSSDSNRTKIYTAFFSTGSRFVPGGF